MIWLLGGYMWLYVHRPFEIWPALGALQIERVYMLVMLSVWLVWPDKGLVHNRIHYALAFFALVLGVSWLLSPYQEQPICSDTIENYFKVAVFYVLVITTVRDERSLRLLLLLFLVAVGLYMAHSLLEFARGRYQWRMGTRRMIGIDVTLSDPNAFASSLLYSLTMTLPFWACRPSKGLRLLLIGFTLTVCVCIALTGSRSGFIGLCVFALLAMLLTVRRKLLVLVFAGFSGVVLLAVAAVALPADLQNRYLTIIDPSYGPKNAEVSAKGRMDGFLFGVEAWEKSPLIGHGPRAFDFVTGRMGGAHNLYGQVLSEMGALGAVALLALVLCFALNSLEVWRTYRRDPDRPRDFSFHVSRAIGLNIVLMLMLGWGGHSLFRYHWQWFAAFQAIAVHCIRKKPLARAAAPAPRGPDAFPYLVVRSPRPVGPIRGGPRGLHPR